MAMLKGLLLLFLMFSIGEAKVKACPCGWSKFGARCYRYFPHAVSWVTAQRSCVNLGATLASSQNSLENLFLARLTPGYSRFWLGGHDGEQKRQWLWADGTHYNFASWCRGEPNNFRRTPENCIEFIENRFYRCWNDLTCSSSRPYICVTNL